MLANKLQRASLLALLLGLCVGVCACVGKRVPRDYEAPTVGAMVAVLQGLGGRAQSFRAETVMDYWVGNDRQKGTVKIMAARGKKMRINALNPAGDGVAMDFACDGANFAMVDFINDCQLTGPCDATSVERFFRIAVEPDVFIDIATGGAPVLGTAPDLAASSTWDSKLGAERLALVGPGSQQTVWLGGRANGWAVVRTDVFNDAGVLQWRLENKDFSRLKFATSEEGEAGTAAIYVPGKSRFRAPQEKSDLLIEWQSRTINPVIPADKFVVNIPEGLPACGANAPAAKRPAH